MHIKEEGTPVTTTNNAGAGLEDPKKPIAPNNVFRRAKSLSDKKKKTVSESDSKSANS